MRFPQIRRTFPRVTQLDLFHVKVTVDLQGMIFCDFSLSRQSKHYQFNYIFQKKLFKNLEMHASYPQKRVFK